MTETRASREIAAWRASTVRIVLASQAVCSLLALALVYGFTRGPNVPVFVRAGGAACALQILGALVPGVPARIRLGVLLGTTAFACASPFFTGGVDGYALLAAGALVALSGILVNGRLGAAAAVFALGLDAAFVAAAALGKVAPRFPQGPAAEQGVFLLAAALPHVVAVAVAVGRFSDRLRGSLVQAVSALEEGRRAQERLAESEKLELAGRLAGGAAHDLNNTLTVIIGNAEGLRDSVRDAEGRAMVEEIVEAARSAASLTQQMLVVTRRAMVSNPAEPLDATALVNRTARAIRRLLPPEIELAVDAPKPATVLADPVQLQQVLLNLAVNARDAMPRGGRLRVAVVAGEEPLAPSVRIAVEDTGVGMDAETERRAFEPFFSTKGGRGTGLGLANVRHVAEALGGRVELRTAEGHGTCVTLVLPAVEPAEKVHGPGSESPPSFPGARALVVEDDVRVRAAECAALAGAGCRVDEARSGADGLALLSSGEGYDLLLTDVLMPGVPFHEVIRMFRLTCPSGRVVVCSAYADDVDLQRSVELGEFVFLRKPFTRAELLAAAGRALGHERRGGAPSPPRFGT